MIISHEYCYNNFGGAVKTSQNFLPTVSGYCGKAERNRILKIMDIYGLKAAEIGRRVFTSKANICKILKGNIELSKERYAQILSVLTETKNAPVIISNELSLSEMVDASTLSQEKIEKIIGLAENTVRYIMKGLRKNGVYIQYEKEIRKLIIAHRNKQIQDYYKLFPNN